jgi:hypothetical protein
MNDDAGDGEDGVDDTGRGDGDDDQDDHSEGDDDDNGSDDDDDDDFYTKAWFLSKSRAVNIVGLLNDSLSCQML